ncbi:TPA: hypothetical protein ACH1HT_005359, partial [Klebsiella pneumoniae]
GMISLSPPTICNSAGYLNRHKPAAPALIKGGALNSTYTRG